MEQHTYLDYTLHGAPCFLVLCDHPGCNQLASVIIGHQMLCQEHAEAVAHAQEAGGAGEGMEEEG